MSLSQHTSHELWLKAALMRGHRTQARDQIDHIYPYDWGGNTKHPMKIFASLAAPSPRAILSYIVAIRFWCLYHQL